MYISNLMRSARLRKNLHQVRSKQKKNNLDPKYFGTKEQKGLSMIAM